MKLARSSLRALGKSEAFSQREALQLGAAHEAGWLRREGLLAMTGLRSQVFFRRGRREAPGEGTLRLAKASSMNQENQLQSRNHHPFPDPDPTDARAGWR